LTNCLRAGGRAGFNYTFLTQKERDNETGLDYFGARYFSSTQGRFTSPDEFTGGPHEVFGEVLGPTPLLYAEPTEPQSLNKYNYCLGNPLRYVDPDGHQTAQADALILPPPPATTLNVAIGAGKAVANIGIGINNFSAGFLGGEKVAPYQAENLTQGVTMVVVEDVSLFGAFLGGRGPAGVMTAEAKQTGAVAAELGGARVAAETTGQATAQASKQGIYEFADAANKGKTYVGQSGNMPSRLQQHGRTGRLAPGSSPTTTAVGGGRTTREVAEQGRINQLGGTRNVPGSKTSNIRNPVSKQRQKKLGVEE